MRRLLCLLSLTAGARPSHADEPRAVVERGVAALGGKELLARQTAWSYTFRATIDLGPNMVLTGVMSAQPPDRQKMTAQLKQNDQEFDMAHAVLGKKGWRRLAGMLTDVPEQEIAAQAAYAHADRALRLLPLLEDRGVTLTALPEEKVEGRPAVGVKATAPERPDVSLWFDKESGLPVKVEYRAAQGPGQPETLNAIVLGDYRDPDDGTAEEKTLAAADVKADAAAVRAFLRRQVPDADSVKKARDAVKRLADDDFAVREKAALDVLALGAAAVAPLEAALLDDDLEMARRARACLEQIKTHLSLPTTLAAVRWLGLTAPPGAAEALLDSADGAEAGVTAEIKAVLTALALRPGGPPAALTAALADRSAARRAVAEAALGRDGGAYLKSARRVFLPGLKHAMKMSMLRQGRVETTFVVQEVRYYSRFDDKEFDKPKD